MNAPGEISMRRSAHAIHFETDGLEFLELRRRGDCIIRSIAPDGTAHEHVQHHPGLLKAMADAPGGDFAIGIEGIPTAIGEHFLIPSVITFFPSTEPSSRILMAREPIGEMQLRLLRDHLGPIFGVLNCGKLYRHKDDMG